MMGFYKKWYKKAEYLEEKVKILQKQLELSECAIVNMSKGNFEFNLYNDNSYKSENILSHSIFKSLKELSNQMSHYSMEEKQRRWVSDGLTQFVDIMRSDHSFGKEELFQKILSTLIRYLNANQGGIFIYNDQEKVLDMVSCYAYDKKKYIDKRIRPGEGLLGQCFLEAETTMYTDLPPFYVHITSGLGEATPGCLLLVPLKFNEEVIGVVEIASFFVFEKYQIEFLEKLSESIASLTLNIRNSEKARQLLVEAEQREQMLKEHEEEMRQNMEELMATQEEMERKQKELDQKSHMLKLIIDNIPFPVFVKDEKGCYTLVNKAEAALFGIPEEKILGLDDSHFVNNEEEWIVIRDSDARTLISPYPVELPVQSFTTTNGKSYTFKTTKVPFENTLTGQRNILGVSIDLTEKMTLEKKLLKERMITENNILLDLAGRQRMLSQKIGFYAEMIVRGNITKLDMLRKAIQLHEHSLSVIRYGGIPEGMSHTGHLEKADEHLLPFIKEVEETWSIYREAAEKIIDHTHTSDKTNIKDMELAKWITVIEEYGEILLKRNNQLMQECNRKNERILLET